jgi:hypothetical protein
MALRGDYGTAGAHVGLRLGIGCRRLFKSLPRASFGLRQRLLALLLLARLDLLRRRRDWAASAWAIVAYCSST